MVESSRRILLYLIIAESALEIVPEPLRGHPAIKHYASKRKMRSDQVFLDRSYHHTAMKGLEDRWKRGRPDIVHTSLLQALGTPLNKRGMLRVYVHTLDHAVIEVNPRVRLPKNYDRFLSLLEQLYQIGRIPLEGEALMILKRRSLKELVKDLNPKRAILLTTGGRPRMLREICDDAAKTLKTIFIVGGFPAGDFSSETKSLADEAYRIFEDHLEASIIISRLIYQYELSTGLGYQPFSRGSTMKFPATRFHD